MPSSFSKTAADANAAWLNQATGKCAAAEQAPVEGQVLSERELEDRGVRLAAMDMAIRSCGPDAETSEILGMAAKIEAFVKPPKAPPPPPSIPIERLHEALTYSRVWSTPRLALSIALVAEGFRLTGCAGGSRSRVVTHLVGFGEAAAPSRTNPLLAAMRFMIDQLQS